MTWWQGKPMRLLQTNLREIDLPLDPGEYADTAAGLGANVVLFNLGGIVANYPTRLPFHYHNPRLTEDMIGPLIEELHRRGIRFIGRFDFSKVNEAIGAEHPDWLYRSARGETVNYNGQMHVCVNSAYQQRHALEILDEATAMYPLDGVFFNMIGYVTWDYSGGYHGPCQCENCRARFFDYCGEDLPVKEDRDDPVYRRYMQFTSETSRELFLRIRDGVKARRADCAICTYISDGIDIVRSESNSGIRRAQPEFVYDASLNVRRVSGSWPGLAASNAAVHFIDFPYRHAAVSPALTARRMAQNFIHGGWLDYYVIGRLEEQQDRACQPEVRRLFHLHRQAEDWLAGAQPLADVCLVQAGAANPTRNPDELRGLLSLLSEAHVLYDVVDEAALAADPRASERLARYPLVIVPDIPYLSPGLAAALDAYARGGGRLLLTGFSASAAEDGAPLDHLSLACAGGTAVRQHAYVPGAYFALSGSDRPNFPELEAVDWIPMDSEWLECAPPDEARALLRFVPVGMYGPPEKCYYTEITGHPGVVVVPAGEGACALVPWRLGSQYRRFPTHAIAGLLQGVLDRVLGLPRSIRVEAPPVVEVSAFTLPAGGLLLGLVNLSGQNGPAIHAPLPVFDLRFQLEGSQTVRKVETLTQGELSYEQAGESAVEFTLPGLDLMEMIRVTG